MFILKVSTLLQDQITMEHHNHNCDLTQIIFVIIFVVFHWAFMCYVVCANLMKQYQQLRSTYNDTYALVWEATSEYDSIIIEAQLPMATSCVTGGSQGQLVELHIL